MTTIKSFTDLSQSKVLAEILPLESADAFYIVGKKPVDIVPIYGSVTHQHLLEQMAYKRAIPCWSLAALLDVLPDNYIDVDDTIKRPSLMKTKDSRYMVIYSAFQYTSLYNNSVDACYEMIVKLHELNLLWL